MTTAMQVRTIYRYRSVSVILRLWSLTRVGSFQMDINRIKDSENSAMRHANRKALIEPLPRDHMRPAKAVKLGEEFLKGIS